MGSGQGKEYVGTAATIATKAVAGAEILAKKKKERPCDAEIDCNPYISGSDFNDVIKQYQDKLSADDLACIKRAREELQAQKVQLWANAEFYIEGEKHRFMLHSGNRQNKFICFKAEEKKFVAYLEQGGLIAPSGTGAAVKGLMGAAKFATSMASEG